MSFLETLQAAHKERQARLNRGKGPSVLKLHLENHDALTGGVEPPAPRSSTADDTDEYGLLVEGLRKEVGVLQGKLTALARDDDTPLVIKSPVKPIVIAVAKYYGVSLTEIMSARRHSKPMRARQVAMYLAKELTTRTLPAIGKVMARDHSTVFHNVQKIGRLLATDEVLRKEVAELRAILVAA